MSLEQIAQALAQGIHDLANGGVPDQDALDQALEMIHDLTIQAIQTTTEQYQ